jgi:Uma2 family endonuclease
LRRTSWAFSSWPPDLSVEIVSPSNTVNEMSRKVAEYLDAGAALIWVVEPLRRQVTVITPDRMARIIRDGDVLDGGDILPGFRLPVSEIFGRAVATPRS